MGRGLEKPRNFYAPNQSPLYKLTTRARLIQILRWSGTPAELKSLVERQDNYHVFPNEKGRLIQAPKPAIEKLHRRLANLLVRVTLPDYLHSGRRQRSFITNGRAHVNGLPVLKLDIEKFYPSTNRNHIYRWFLDEMKCAPDVAQLLSLIACFRQECLPTGSCLSQLLAFHVHKRMFDAIAAYADERGGVFTVYVDDIVVSMPHVSWARIDQIGRFIEQQGLKWHKARLYLHGTPKVVTGTVAKATHLEAPNKTHRKLRKALDVCLLTPIESSDRSSAVARVIGIAGAIGQVDLRRKTLAESLRNMLNSAEKLS